MKDLQQYNKDFCNERGLNINLVLYFVIFNNFHTMEESMFETIFELPPKMISSQSMTRFCSKTQVPDILVRNNNAKKSVILQL